MIWLVGAGEMSVAYTKVLDAQKCEYEVVGRGEASAVAFKEKTGVEVHVGGLDTFLANSPKLPSAAIVSVGVEHLFDTSMALLNYGVKSLLIEKPGGLELSEINQLQLKGEAIGAEVFIAYNRRFYSSVIKARELIEKEGGVTSFNFELTEWSHIIGGLEKPKTVLSKWFLANSTHVADMAFFLGGKPEEICCFTAGGLDWHEKASIFAGAGVATNGAIFNYAANWESAGRWSVEILTKENRYIFRPMESLQVQKRGTIPHIEIEVDNQIDIDYKPGLYKQVECFLNGNTKDLCSITEHLSIFAIYEKMANYN
jgi:predicted dehydrogenase